MKKSAAFLLLALLANTAFCQVFNNGQTLKPKTFSLGIEPGVMVNSKSEFILFLHGGYGIKDGIDLSANVGVLGPAEYFGADVEFGLPNRMSFAVGAHQMGDFGLDGAWNIAFPIKNDIRILTGLDSDLNFNSDKTRLYLWLPVGFEIGIRKKVSFIFEAEIGLLDPTYHFIGGGLNFYL
jgi:hypothetical protein